METQAAYTTPMKPEATRIRKAPRKAKSIPDGYMSLDEFGSLFHQKPDEAYALLNPDREEAVDLVKRMQEDLEAKLHRNRKFSTCKVGRTLKASTFKSALRTPLRLVPSSRQLIEVP